MLQIPVSPIADEKVGRSAVANDKERKKMRTKSLVGVLIALLLLAGAAAVSAQDVTQAEKDKALQYLETTKKNVLEATKGLSRSEEHTSELQSLTNLVCRLLLEKKKKKKNINKY